MKFRLPIILIVVLVLALVISGCGPEYTTGPATITCDGFSVSNISSLNVPPDYLNYDSNGDTIPDHMQLSAIATDGAGTVLYSGVRTLIPLGSTLQSAGFTSDSFEFTQPPIDAAITVTYVARAGGNIASDRVFEMYDGYCDGIGDGSYHDGRINPQPYAYASVYCDAASERVLIYGVNSPGAGEFDDGSGFLALEVPYSSLPQTPPGQAELIAQNGHIRFYRNMQGEYAVYAGPDSEGKTYVVLWDHCPPTYIKTFIDQNNVLQATN